MKMTESTDNIANILMAAGVREVVVSSGSRSLRMVRAVIDNGSLNVRMIVDERVAAFFALGISEATNRPVVLVCTSGTAMLNYAPAIAEAFYRGIPLIVITADRPKEMIDINDGQTIHQFHALDNIVKMSIDIDATKECSIEDYNALTKAIIEGLSPRKGPIHINLHLQEGGAIHDIPVRDFKPGTDIISNGVKNALPYDLISYSRSCASEKQLLTPEDWSAVMHNAPLSEKKILLFVGQRSYEEKFDEYINRLSKHDNVVIVTDFVGNCDTDGVVANVEPLMGTIRKQPLMFKPDIFISFGKTSPISRSFKEWLRETGDYQHWRVNDTDKDEDTYYHLKYTIVSDDVAFLDWLLMSIEYDMIKNDTSERTGHYRDIWFTEYHRVVKSVNRLLEEAPWSDIYAINVVLKALPEEYDIQCSNGMSIRYLSLVNPSGRNVYCNRGVNGIDGSTSTALGYASVNNNSTLLITGDMSAVYDISALFSGQLTPDFKMIVIANGGGEIFRLTKATRDYEKRESMLCALPSIDWFQVAGAVGMEYFEANDAKELSGILPRFFKKGDKASLLIVNTPAGNSIAYREIIKQVSAGN